MSYYQPQVAQPPQDDNNLNFYQSSQSAPFGTPVDQSNGFINPSSLPSGSMPTGSMQTSYTYNGNGVDYDPNQLSKGLLAAFSTTGYPGEPPLLEELGVNFQHIKIKTIGVLGFKSTSLSDDVVKDSDMAGPLIFCLLFGTLLLLSGKTHFGYIYGVALFGTVSLHVLFRLMANNGNDSGIDILRTASVLGYCLLPLVMLSAIAVILDLDNTFGYLMGIFAVLWCTFSASGFFVRVLNLTNARVLVAYPLAMFYTVFALMAIFVEKKE
ncbi:DEKNAAC100945 [Brettanomyces naardenensis]|uniref:Protein YIP n=1 Tax=Brettanomyces naardenensis TaxID=13370 RepID=A0A448YGW9_BRENA|nr:DEKNAAC100945 [Brettanomyces naardenensis]